MLADGDALSDTELDGDWLDDGDPANPGWETMIEAQFQVLVWVKPIDVAPLETASCVPIAIEPPAVRVVAGESAVTTPIAVAAPAINRVFAEMVVIGTVVVLTLEPSS